MVFWYWIRSQRCVVKRKIKSTKERLQTWDDERETGPKLHCNPLWLSFTSLLLKFHFHRLFFKKASPEVFLFWGNKWNERLCMTWSKPRTKKQVNWKCAYHPGTVCASSHRMFDGEKASPAGHLWSLGYPPTQSQYRAQLLSMCTAPLGVSLQMAVEISSFD